MGSTFIEYNTDCAAGTYERFRQIARSRTDSGPGGSGAPLFVPQPALESLVRDLFVGFGSRLSNRLAERAIDRLQRPRRWPEVSTSSLICEIVADNLVRKGPLSDAGRLQRNDQIRRAVHNRRIEFAILLLPFRTPSLLKHRGILPDLGEVYTLVLLQSIAKACEQAQGILIDTAQRISATLTADQLASFADLKDRPFPREKFDLNGIMAHAFAMIDAQSVSGHQAASRRQRVRESLFNLKTICIRDGTRFAETLVVLSEGSMSLDAFNAFRHADVIPVAVLAIQDAGRYPCFFNLDRAAVATYRKFLLDMMELLGIESRHLRLIDYGDAAARTEQTARQLRDAFYVDRLRVLSMAMSEHIGQLLACNGKAEFMQCLKGMEADRVVAPLFEPLLFSIQQSAIEDYAAACGCDYEEAYFGIMENVYVPQKVAALERLRAQLISDTLEATCQYCAAYEANTGSKNPAAFDDVSKLFPGALRMSIHAKDETIGHFSISASPTGTRTPWHGTAALSEDSASSNLALSIDLAGHLEMVRQYRPVFVEPAIGPGHAVFERHARSRQPIFYLSAGLASSQEEATGTLWSKLALRGLRERT